MLLYIDHKFLTALGISSFKERYVRVHSLSLRPGADSTDPG
jgi:hypothetical protein